MVSSNVSGINFANQSICYTIDLHSDCDHHQQYLVYITFSDALAVNKNWFPQRRPQKL